MAPANVTQEDARIVSYSAARRRATSRWARPCTTTTSMHRCSTTDANGDARLAAHRGRRRGLQATLQHVVVTYDPVNGRRIYVNGVYTGDVDTAPAARSATGTTPSPWCSATRSPATAVAGRPPPGGHPQPRADAGTDPAELCRRRRREVLPAVQRERPPVSPGQLHDVRGQPVRQLQLPVQQDRPSSAWTRTATPDSIPIRGMRIGVNGVECRRRPGLHRTWTRRSVHRATIAGHGPAAVEHRHRHRAGEGPDADEFFLTFESLGNNTNVVTEPAPLTPPPPANGTTVSDIGVRTFDEINATMRQITGVRRTTPTVSQHLRRRSSSSCRRWRAPEGFLSSHQVGGRAARHRVLQRAGERHDAADGLLPRLQFQRGGRSSARPPARDAGHHAAGQMPSLLARL